MAHAIVFHKEILQGIMANKLIQKNLSKLTIVSTLKDMASADFT